MRQCISRFNTRAGGRESKRWKKDMLLLFAAALLMEALYLFYALNDSAVLLKRNNFYYIIVNGAAFVVFCVAALRIRGARYERAETKKILWLILGAAIAFRATFLFTHTATSDDWYRYGFEGTVLRNGHNPYEVTPSDTSLAGYFSREFYARVILKQMTSMYPPAAHLFFTSGTWLSGERMTGIKIIFLLFDLLTMLLLIRLLRLKGLPPSDVILYAWMPLIIMEFFVNVHIDTAALPFFLLFVLNAENKKPYAAMLSFAAMFLIKTYALFALPLLFRKIHWRKLLLPALTAAALIVCAYLPFLNHSHPVYESLYKYLRHWEFNGSVYNVLKLFFADHVYARSICGVLFVVSSAAVFFRFRDFTKGVYAVYLLFIIFAAAVFPWYLSWIIVLAPAAGTVAPLALAGLANLSNLTPLSPVWKEYQWVWITQYCVFFVFVIYDYKEAIYTFIGKYRKK